jgi:RNA polymerase sigma-70 factor, ECF subfamily
MDALAGRIEDELPRLRRYARVLLRSDVDADDLVQDCVMRALSRTHLWQEGTDLRAWLFTMLHNQFVNGVRRSARQGWSVEVSELDEETHQIPTQDKRLELRDLDRALALLPEEQKDVILLMGLEGMGYKAAAEVVGVPVATVRPRLSRGRDGLRRLMGIKPDSNAEAKIARAAVAPAANVQHNPQATTREPAEALLAPKRQPVVASAVPAGELVRKPRILAALPPAQRGGGENGSASKPRAGNTSPDREIHGCARSNLAELWDDAASSSRYVRCSNSRDEAGTSVGRIRPSS